VTLSVSTPVRIAAFVGLAAALALGGMFMLMGGTQSSAAAPVKIKHHPFGGPVKAHVGTKTHSAAKSASGTKPAPAPVVRKARQRPAGEAAALAAGLPVPLARALGRSSVVVVELFNPTSEVDAIAFAEAKAGAALAGVAFVPLNVLSQADVAALTEQYGQALPDPSLFIYTRPAKLAIRIDGFVDKETVAQAAQNAAPWP
jgi:hypothetical protein